MNKKFIYFGAAAVLLFLWKKGQAATGEATQGAGQVVAFQTPAASIKAAAPVVDYAPAAQPIAAIAPVVTVGGGALQDVAPYIPKPVPAGFKTQAEYDLWEANRTNTYKVGGANWASV